MIVLSGDHVKIVALDSIGRFDSIVLATMRGDPSAGTRTEAPESELLLLGARVFRERCSPCHGDRGRGDGVLADVLEIRPRNYHEDEFEWGASPEEIAATIRSGRSGVMPPFEGALDEREIRAVAELVAGWVRARPALEAE